jgi:hypothetical protein
MIRRSDILREVKGLKKGSFYYWLSKAKIDPVKKEVINNRMTFFYSADAIKKINEVMRENG